MDDGGGGGNCCSGCNIKVVELNMVVAAVAVVADETIILYDGVYIW